MIGVEITISDHGTECTSYYQVEYKKLSDSGWTGYDNQFTSPFQVQGLDEGTAYQFRITRFCCNGQYSNPLIINKTTGASELSPPADFTVVGSLGETSSTWTNDPYVDNYVIDRALDAGFTMSVIEVYNGVYVASFDQSSLPPGTYYYRIRAVKAGFPDSDYSYDDAIVT